MFCRFACSLLICGLFAGSAFAAQPSSAVALGALLLADEKPGDAEHATGADHAAGGGHAAGAEHGAADHGSAGHGAGDHAAGEHGGDHGDEHHATGVPLAFDRDLALWSLVTFLIFLFILRTAAWGPLRTALDKREAKIRGDIAAAEAARMRAEKMLQEHQAKLAQVQDEVKEILAEARRDAEHTRQDIVSTAQREASTMQLRAVTEIERARDQALNELFGFVSRTVAEATEKVVGRTLNDQDQSRLIEEALSEMGNSRN